MVLTTIITSTALAIVTTLTFCKMKKRFKLLSYDHNYNDSDAFYGSDEMAMAYQEYLGKEN